MKAVIGALFGLAIASGAGAQPDGLRFALGLSKPTFFPGEQVFATATLKNASPAALTCIYPMSPGGGFMTLSLRDVTRDQDIRPETIACFAYLGFAGCVLEPGGEYLEVVNLTGNQGKPDSVSIGIPDPRFYHALLPGRYEASAVYYVRSVKGREDYGLHSNLITFEVRPAAHGAADEIWKQLSHFVGNTPEYRDTLSVLVEQNPYDPFVASMYLESSLFDRSKTRRESAFRMVSRHPNSDLAGYVMTFLTTWVALGDMEWPAGFLSDLRDRYPESLATRVAQSQIMYWECYNGSGWRRWERDP